MTRIDLPQEIPGLEVFALISPEDCPPEDCFATGDDEQDRKICTEIREELDYSELAWCVVRVVVRHKESGLEGSETLGGVSILGKYCEDPQAEIYQLVADYDMVGLALKEFQVRVDSLNQCVLCKGGW